MNTKLVAPAEGRRVLAPNGSPVPDKFLADPGDPYWARALRDGDLEVVSEPVAEKPSAPGAPAVVTKTTVGSGGAA